MRHSLTVRLWRVSALVSAFGLAACGGQSADQATSAGTGVDAQVAQVIDVTDKAVLPAAPVAPLKLVGVPDVNLLGLLDKTGPNAAQWSFEKITNPGKKQDLQRLGKALFWDMQVGGDGVQACASCHFHAGADNRAVNQINPGLPAGDKVVDLSVGLNGRLTPVHYTSARQGLPSNEAGFAARGAVIDAADGTPGVSGAKQSPAQDVNDVVSSQGIRAGSYQGLDVGRSDAALLSGDALNGFEMSFTESTFKTVRRVPGRNSPTVLNAVYNLRNFWDGRADAFFNGVNPLGFRDPDARIRAYDPAGGTVRDERLDLPFSSLASQAVGPIGSDFEMVYSGRPLRDLGRKLTRAGAVPLAGQLVAADDSLLGALRAGSGRGLATSYADWIRATFDSRFWGYASGGVNVDVCVDANGAKTGESVNGTTLSGSCDAYTLMQYNFPLFFGLAVQAYEAILVTDVTLVDLIAGGVATGVVMNGRKRLDVTNVALDGCVAGVANGGGPAERDLALRLCSFHYARFIPAGATSGSESATAPSPVPPFTPISGCPGNPANGQTLTQAQLRVCNQAMATLSNVNRGLGRWFAGATSCSVCHFNPEFTGATVSTITGFGVGPELAPPGQARRVERRAIAERMVSGNGLPAVYDTGFYNIAVRPTPEDLSIGDAIGGVPLALTKLMDIINGGNPTSGNGPGIVHDTAKISRVANLVPTLRIPTSTTDLTPIAFPLTVGCGLGLTGGGNANGNPNATCTFTVIPGERLQRNGSFKSPGVRNAMFTGPYMHNGSKMNLRQVLEFYKVGGHFQNQNLNNLDAGLRVFDLGVADESAVVELMEIGLTDWRVAFKRDQFDHPELCIPNGHDPVSGKSRLVGLPAVGRTGTAGRLQTFEEQLRGINARNGVSLSNTLTDACTVTGVGGSSAAPIVDGNGLSTVDLPPILPANIL